MTAAILVWHGWEDVRINVYVFVCMGRISLERRRPMDEVVYASERLGMETWVWTVL